MPPKTIAFTPKETEFIASAKAQVHELELLRTGGGDRGVVVNHARIGG